MRGVNLLSPCQPHIAVDGLGTRFAFPRLDCPTGPRGYQAEFNYIVIIYLIVSVSIFAQSRLVYAFKHLAPVPPQITITLFSIFDCDRKNDCHFFDPHSVFTDSLG